MMNSKTPIKKVKYTQDHDLKSILKKTPLKSSVSVSAVAVPQTTRSATRQRSITTRSVTRQRSISKTKSTGGT